MRSLTYGELLRGNRNFRNLLAGPTLLLSAGFLLRAVASALGEWPSAYFGYRAAFVLNAASFLISAWKGWPIPEEPSRDDVTAERMRDKPARPSFTAEFREGF